MDSERHHGQRSITLHHTHKAQAKPHSFVRAGTKTYDTGMEMVKPRFTVLLVAHSGRVDVDVGEESASTSSALQPLRSPSMIRPEHRTSADIV